MDTVKIENKNIFVAENFSMIEFWKPTITPICFDFDLYICLPKALQVVRNFACELFKKNTPWEITSAWRPNEPLSLPSAHRVIPPAVDSIPMDRNLWGTLLPVLRDEFKNWEKSSLVQAILDTGTNVLLIEPTCLHLHWRTKNNHHPDQIRYPNGLYIGEWSDTNGKGVNIPYSYEILKYSKI